MCRFCLLNIMLVCRRKIYAVCVTRSGHTGSVYTTLVKNCGEEASWRVLGIDGMLIILKFVLKEWVLKCGLK
jgi:hypothetical protein